MAAATTVVRGRLANGREIDRGYFSDITTAVMVGDAGFDKDGLLKVTFEGDLPKATRIRIWRRITTPPEQEAAFTAFALAESLPQVTMANRMARLEAMVSALMSMPTTDA